MAAVRSLIQKVDSALLALVRDLIFPPTNSAFVVIATCPVVSGCNFVPEISFDGFLWNTPKTKTITRNCYEKVRQETEKIKAKLLASYDAYAGKFQDRETLVLYEGEKRPSGEFWEGKQIIEMEKKRPEWFSRDLRKRWNKLKTNDFPERTD